MLLPAPLPRMTMANKILARHSEGPPFWRCYCNLADALQIVCNVVVSFARAGTVWMFMRKMNLNVAYMWTCNSTRLALSKCYDDVESNWHWRLRHKSRQK